MNFWICLFSAFRKHGDSHLAPPFPLRGIKNQTLKWTFSVWRNASRETKEWVDDAPQVQWEIHRCNSRNPERALFEIWGLVDFSSVDFLTCWNYCPVTYDLRVFSDKQRISSGSFVPCQYLKPDCKWVGLARPNILFSEVQESGNARQLLFVLGGLFPIFFSLFGSKSRRKAKTIFSPSTIEKTHLTYCHGFLLQFSSLFNFGADLIFRWELALLIFRFSPFSKSGLEEERNVLHTFRPPPKSRYFVRIS